MENKDRTEAFKKDIRVEEILDLLDDKLSPIEDELTSGYNSTRYPTVFIFGCARSGTTVLHQYLVQNTKCIYPSNFISRFYYAPYLGGMYYKLFTDLDKKGELLDSRKERKEFFSSDLGKTKGIHSPNEFWYFWRKYFPINERGTIEKQKIIQKESNRFRRSIYGLQNFYEGPFITKGMIANNCIDYLEKLFPKAIFIFLQRDLYANAKSLYKARIDYFNDPQQWYSFYPKEKQLYEGMKPEEQVVQQILDTNKEIKDSLSRCKKNRVITVDYSSFCQSPENVLTKLQAVDESVLIKKDPFPIAFEVREKKSLSSETDRIIKSKINDLIR